MSARARRKPARFMKPYKRKKGGGRFMLTGNKQAPKADFSNYDGDAVASLALAGLLKSMFGGNR